jgi:hypothetical protein
MRIHILRLLLAAGIASASADGGGGSAIITLVMPPPGGDGYAALQAGGALAQGATSIYYNPALMAEMYRSTGSQLFFSQSRQNLLPVLGLKDLNQEFRSVAAVAPDPVSGTDVAVGFFRNHVNFGASTRTDAEGNVIDRFDSWETIYGAGIAVRLGIPISVGATAKFIDSHLAYGFDGLQAYYGWAFDAGVLANPKISPAARLGLPDMVFTPSIGLAVRNIGPDIFYKEVYQADPIPTTYSTAYGFKGEFFDLLEFEVGADLDHEWTHRSENWDQVRSLGYSGLFWVVRYSEGWLDDPLGNRFEKHVAKALEFNLLRWTRLRNRFATGDFKSPSRSMERGFPFRDATVGGIPFRANPRFEIGIREIHSRGNGVREGQESKYYLNLSL